MTATASNTATTAPFTPGQRVTRHRLDNAVGTVESVQAAGADYTAEFGVEWFVAVRLDQDGEVWSGTETAWAVIDTAAVPA